MSFPVSRVTSWDWTVHRITSLPDNVPEGLLQYQQNDNARACQKIKKAVYGDVYGVAASEKSEVKH